MDQLSAETDLDLVARFCRGRDEAAFAAITQRYGPMVFAVCHRILRDRARAEEVTQETFFRLTQHCDTVCVSLAGWLHRTATQLAIDALRGDTRRQDREAAYAAHRPSHATAWTDVAPLVDEALQSMPVENRTLLAEHFLAGKSQADLAKELNVSTATLSRRMHCALEQLRAILHDRGVVAAPALLLGFLAGALAAGAVSPRLATGLGKIAMVSALGGVWHSPAAAVKTAGAITFALVATMGKSASAATWSAVVGGTLLAGALDGDAPQPVRDQTWTDSWTTRAVDTTDLPTKLGDCLRFRIDVSQWLNW